LFSVFNGDLPLSLWRRKESRELISLHLVAPVYARSGDRMAENVEDGNGAKRAFSNLAKAAVKLASVASSSAICAFRKLHAVATTSSSS
jgi:hypothetical protein